MVFFDQIGHWSIVPLGGISLMIAWFTLAIGTFFPSKSIAGTGFSNG